MSARKYWLGFNAISGIGPVRFRALLRHFDDLADAWAAGESDLRAAGLDRATVENILAERPRLDLERLIDQVDRIGASVLTLEDPDYPSLLAELPDAPPVLYVKGTLLDQDRWAVAFVGTRRASVYGRDVTYSLVTPLVNAGITIVSGLALGIDAAAHRAALEAGGRTIAVLGSGIDVIYPQEHAKLAAEITRSGALVSIFAPGTKPEAHNFPLRNRIVSGLALGTVVVEAPTNSGALLTADAAADQGRDVFAVPGNINARTSAGTNALIQAGAKLVMGAEDILDELNLTRTTVETHAQIVEIAPDNEIEAALLDALADAPRHIDDLCQCCGLSITDVSSTLALMELKGMVRRLEGMHYALARSGREPYRLD